MTNSTIYRPWRWIVRAIGVWCLLASAAPAQELWEFSPYKLRVWVVIDSATALAPAYRQQLETCLTQRAESLMPAVWDLTTAEPPAEIAAAAKVDLQLILREDVERVATDELQQDKLMLLYVGATPQAYQVRAREMDCRTRMFGPIIERSVRQSRMLAAECFAAIVDAFAAVVRIEQGEGSRLTVRLRAGGLITDLASPAHVAEGDILRPVVRRNDRLGEPTSIGVVQWTYLQVDRRSEINPNLLQVHVHSGWRNPIRGRTGSRREQYALSIRPRWTTTELVVEAKPLRRGEASYPLADLEIYAKRATMEPPPQTPEEKQAAEKRNPPQFLGRTDWRGALQVTRGAQPLRLLYIKNGGQLLARLPMVPGLVSSQVAQVPDDDARLQAEGYIKGYNGELMDLVAQRRMLAAKIRRRLEERQVAEAERLLERFRELPSRSDMVRELDQQQTRQRPSPNRMVQQRIENLYADTRRMLSKYLDPGLAGQLLNELNQARQSGD